MVIGTVLSTFYCQGDCWGAYFSLLVLSIILIIIISSFGVASLLYSVKLETKRKFPKYLLMILTILYLVLEALKFILMGYTYVYFRIGFPIDKDFIHPTAFVLMFSVYPLFLMIFGITNLLLSRNYEIKTFIQSKEN